VSGGGGGKKFGIVNKIDVYEAAPILKNIKSSLDTDEFIAVDLVAANR